jgi:hypothetical protein
MGRSSGGYFRSTPEELDKKVQSSDRDTNYQMYESEVLALLNKILADCNDRDVKAIDIHLKEIRRAIENRIDDTINIMFGGSVSKHTYVDGLSDIDALVILNQVGLQGKSPQDVNNMFAAMLKNRYPNSDISVGKMAVTIKFSDCEIQLLPAIKNRNALTISDGTGRQWSKINPKEFTSKLTEINQKNGGKVIPVIKLAKSLIGNFSEKQQLSGYHVESLAVEAFKNYTGALNAKEMLQHFFKESTRRVLSPIVDKTGQSYHVDDYLGSTNSDLRKVISNSLNRISRKLVNADNVQSWDVWEDIFN